MSSIDLTAISGPRKVVEDYILDDLPRDFFHGGVAPAGIHSFSLAALQKGLCFNDHRRGMWAGLIGFLAIPALTRKFSSAYLGGGFASLKEEPKDIDLILETNDEYGPKALSSISRFFLVGLDRIELLYGVHLHFWMKNAPPGISDFRTFFQYDKFKNDSSVFSPARGLFQIDLQACDILQTIRRQITHPTDLSTPSSEILPDMDPRVKALERLAAALHAISRATTLDSIIDLVKKEARRVLRADGATFVLRDGAHCHYVDEDAVSPLWKGQRFPMSNCISGWAMMNRSTVAIADIQTDDRIPLAAYRSTFVKSLLMTPLGTKAPIGAIGIYWSQRHEATSTEIELAQALADATSVAMQNVELRARFKLHLSENERFLEDANLQFRSFARNVDKFRETLSEFGRRAHRTVNSTDTEP